MEVVDVLLALGFVLHGLALWLRAHKDLVAARTVRDMRDHFERTSDYWYDAYLQEACLRRRLAAEVRKRAD